MSADTGQLTEKKEEYFTQFNVICVTAADSAMQVCEGGGGSGVGRWGDRDRWGVTGGWDRWGNR